MYLEKYRSLKKSIVLLPNITQQIGMKAKLLKKLREEGRSQVDVYSITRTNGYITGMGYSHPGEGYRDLWNLGNSEEVVKNKACDVWLSLNVEKIRKRYYKFTRRYKIHKGQY